MLAWLRVAAAMVSGTALWLSSGALALSNSSPNAERVGVLPGVGWWLVCAGAVGALAHVSPPRVVWLLLGGVLAWLPWLPGRVPPVFDLWLGPVLGMGATVATLVALGTRERPWPSWLSLWCVNPRRATLLAFSASALLYTVGPFQLDEHTPGGDEPHYLVMTQSLLRDRDLRIENNHREGHYWEYFHGELRPDFLRRGTNGEIYSVHAPGVSALIAPAYAIAGYRGATAFLILLSALGACLAWRLAFAVTTSAGAAWFGWAATAWSVPFTFHAFTVYPDGPAAVIVLVGVWALVETERATVRSRAIQGAVLALLPWLHTRYAVLAAALGIAIGLRDWSRTDRWRRTLAFAATPLISAAAWFAFFRVIYGTFSPAAPYGGVRGTDSSLENLVRGFPALLFDQQFGLVANAPALMCGLLGLWTLARRNAATRRLALEFVLVCLPYAALSSSYQMWWGGYSAPARFLTPLVLVLAVPAAATWAFARHSATRVFSLAALGVTLFITGAFLLVGEGRLVYNNRDGVALWLEWVSPLADLNAALPAFHGHPYGVALQQAGIWFAALALSWLLARALCGPVAAGGSHARPTEGSPAPPAPASAAALALLLAAIGVSAAIVVVWTMTESRTTAVTNAQAWVLRTASHRTDLLSVRYPNRSGVHLPWVGPMERELPRLHVTSNVRRMPTPAPALLVRQLPAGHYRLHAPFRAGAEGEVRAAVGRTSMLVDSWPIPQGPNQRELQADLVFPVPIHSLTISTDDRAKDAVRGAWLEPVSLGSVSSALRDVQALRAIRYGEFVVYFLSDDAFMEPTGFWLRPEVETTVVASAPARAEPLKLFLRNGPVVNSIRLSLGDWSETATLRPGEEREFVTTASQRGEAMTLLAYAASGFRPSEVDPASTDMRLLSCWVELR